MIHYLEAAEIAEKETERHPFDSSLCAEALRIYGCALAEVTVLLRGCAGGKYPK
jgi:hypothetical protein